jgi:hypothetical protein
MFGLMVLIAAIAPIPAQGSLCDEIHPESHPEIVEQCLLDRFEAERPKLDQIIHLYDQESSGENVWACNPTRSEECNSELRQLLAETHVFWVGVSLASQHVLSVFEGGEGNIRRGYFFVYPTHSDRVCTAELMSKPSGSCEIQLDSGWALARNWFTD